MSRIVMYPHGGSGNHGCEAIVRTTTGLLKKNEIILFSENPEEDYFYLGSAEYTIKKPVKTASHFSLKYINALIRNKRGNAASFDELYFDPIISSCDQRTVLLSIGGDNYCYGDNEYIYLVNHCARQKGAKTVLWGCSIEPDSLTERMKTDLKEYDLIIARESSSYEVLKCINSNTKLCPDPAFLLGQKKGLMPEGLEYGMYVGINVSPMIQSHEKTEGITLKNYANLIEHILKNSDDNIALIPHVVWSHNDDRVPLQKLYSQYNDTGRVFLIPDQNCMQLKNVISGCRLFIGARTHSTIAAYSTQVPTLVVGYSNKAVGIASDLFGTDKNYVLPVQSLASENDLLSAYIWLENHADDIRQKYQHMMPEYIAKAEMLKTVLDGYLRD
ncbi:MAG: polysaccharide pyruvyl transferase family protein [Solobacterium sp.]|nr:polysaccharide pyruvyl transferase family protein [Solobacterium sp.]